MWNFSLFFVKGSPSAPAGSCTGFVEGCGFSVAAMAILNHVLHRFMEVGSPETTFSTYVDNYELEACSVQRADQAFSRLESFWAIHAAGRSELRQMQVQPQFAMKDLGRHMQASGKQ